MMNQCEVVQDLLPLYSEQELSQVSIMYVESHLRKCNHCTIVNNEMIKSQNFNLNINTQLLGKGKTTLQEIEFITKLKKWKRDSTFFGISLIILLSFLFRIITT